MEFVGLFFLELSRSLGALDHVTEPRWLQWLAVSTGAFLLVGRRRYPLTVGVLASAHMFVVGIAMPMVMGQLSLQVVYFVAYLSMVSWGRERRTTFLVISLVVLSMFVWVAWQLVVGSGVDDMLAESDSVTPQGIFTPVTAAVLITVSVNILYFFGAVLGGQVSWRSARQKARLAEQAETIATQADTLRRQAIVDERLRIARELHDVVGHHVSVIGVQAGAARRVLQRDPNAAAAALSTIETSSRDAVTQMRALLGTLRDLEGDQSATLPGMPSRAPEPGVSDLPMLAAERTANGTETAFELVETPTGAAQTLSGPESLTLYRVAQEALANVARHSTAQAARVVLRVVTQGARPYAEVEILDDGRPMPGTSGSGLGQLGMRERVASLHGVVEIGPRVGGGYRVRVRIPLGGPP
ncbi:MAG: sensor histidine kinase [Phycicoccus sp.]|nr:sensor histidine kinase [Phycicoccus sp.]